MSDDLYERDILAWSERQADLLRRVAVSERQPDVDWARVIEEIEAVGTAQLNDARGLIRQAMICLVRMHLARDEATRPAALLELACVRDDVAEQITPSMKQRIDLALIWTRLRARSQSADTLSGALPDHCPWTVDALLTDDPATLLAALAGWPFEPNTSP